MTSISLRPIFTYSKEFPPVRRYYSYLLRIWREDEQMPWRIQIENPHTHEVIGFQNIEKLVNFLNEQALRTGGDVG